MFILLSLTPSEKVTLTKFVLLSLLCFVFNVEVCRAQNNDIESTELFKHLEKLSSKQMMGRKTGTKGNQRARQYIIEELKAANVHPFDKTFEQEFSFVSKNKEYRAANIVGVLLPKNRKSNDYIVLTAHFDHVGSKGKHIYYGTDDNASGTSALLAIAKTIDTENLNHNILFLFTDGEELGLHGARFFVQKYSELLPNIKLNINVDMLSGNRRLSSLYYIARNLDTVLEQSKLQQFSDLIERAPVNLRKNFRHRINAMNKKVRWLYASDHGVFYKNGVPFVYYGVGVHKNYHSVKDTYENANLELFLNSTRAIYSHIVFFDENISSLKVDQLVN